MSAQRSYTAEYRADAVKLAEQIGGSAAARQLKMPVETLYMWISRSKNGGLPAPPDRNRPMGLAERNRELERENERLKAELKLKSREMEILEGAAAFFAARRKKSGNA